MFTNFSSGLHYLQMSAGGIKMETLGETLFHLFATIAVLIIVWMLMGKRQLGELSPVDFSISIAAGTVAGSTIADPRIAVGHALLALVLLGLIQFAVSRLSICFRTVHNAVSFEPTVLVENGQVIKKNLRKIRMPVEMVLQLLREKGVFDIREVEVAIFEPHGKLSVLKKADRLPLNASQLQMAVAPNKIIVPVVIEGQLQKEMLKKMGFSQDQIEEFHAQHERELQDVFIAFMDKNRELYIVKDDVAETGIFLY